MTRSGRVTILFICLVPFLTSLRGDAAAPSAAAKHPKATGDETPQRALPTESAAHKSPPRDGREKFDFLMGAYRIHNRRLKDRLKGSKDWQEFEATNVARKLLDGLGNEDEYRTEFWPGFKGMSFRFFNPKTRKWAIYWANNQSGVLDAPLYGSFTGNRGVFETTELSEGKPVRERYIWSRTDTPTPRWEQAFSIDDGKTWETNWIMDFTRDKP
jgi:hypothetical protein